MMNIAASAAAENADSSFIARNASTMSPLPITLQWEGHEPSQFYLSNENAYRDEVASSPFDKRAWVVQEVWLASRNFYLTKNQLWWKCCEIEASEAYPECLPETISSRDPSPALKNSGTMQLDYIIHGLDSLRHIQLAVVRLLPIS
ncbi:hypothetical protein WAI453_009415 [Rhynchosporium graminicola]